MAGALRRQEITAKTLAADDPIQLLIVPQSKYDQIQLVDAAGISHSYKGNEAVVERLKKLGAELGEEIKRVAVTKNVPVADRFWNAEWKIAVDPEKKAELDAILNDYRDKVRALPAQVGNKEESMRPLVQWLAEKGIEYKPEKFISPENALSNQKFSAELQKALLVAQARDSAGLAPVPGGIVLDSDGNVSFHSPQDLALQITCDVAYKEIHALREAYPPKSFEQLQADYGAPAPEGSEYAAIREQFAQAYAGAQQLHEAGKENFKAVGLEGKGFPSHYTKRTLTGSGGYTREEPTQKYEDGELVYQGYRGTTDYTPPTLSYVKTSIDMNDYPAPAGLMLGRRLIDEMVNFYNGLNPERILPPVQFSSADGSDSGICLNATCESGFSLPPLDAGSLNIAFDSNSSNTDISVKSRFGNPTVVKDEIRQVMAGKSDGHTFHSEDMKLRHLIEAGEKAGRILKEHRQALTGDLEELFPELQGWKEKTREKVEEMKKEPASAPPFAAVSGTHSPAPVLVSEALAEALNELRDPPPLPAYPVYEIRQNEVSKEMRVEAINIKGQRIPVVAVGSVLGGASMMANGLELPVVEVSDPEMKGVMPVILSRENQQRFDRGENVSINAAAVWDRGPGRRSALVEADRPTDRSQFIGAFVTPTGRGKHAGNEHTDDTNGPFPGKTLAAVEFGEGQQLIATVPAHAIVRIATTGRKGGDENYLQFDGRELETDQHPLNFKQRREAAGLKAPRTEEAQPTTPAAPTASAREPEAGTAGQASPAAPTEPETPTSELASMAELMGLQATFGGQARGGRRTEPRNKKK